MHHGPHTLKEKGHKITPQRLAIWHLLLEGGHYSAEEISSKLEENFPGIDRSTVYRTLELLTELKLIQETKLPHNAARFEATDQLGHHHLVCTECREIYHFEHSGLFAALNDVAQKADFKEPSFDVCIKGICKICEQKAAK